MSLDRPYADHQFFGDPVIRIPFGDQFEHFHLAFRQHSERSRLFSLQAAEGFDDPRGDLRVQGGLPPGGMPDGFEKLCCFYVFEQVRDRAGLQGWKDIFILMERGQDDDLGARADVLDPSCGAPRGALWIMPEPTRRERRQASQ